MRAVGASRKFTVQDRYGGEKDPGCLHEEGTSREEDRLDPLAKALKAISGKDEVDMTEEKDRGGVEIRLKDQSRRVARALGLLRDASQSSDEGVRWWAQTRNGGACPDDL